MTTTPEQTEPAENARFEPVQGGVVIWDSISHMTNETAEQTALTMDEIDAVHSTIEMELHPCASQERAREIADYVRKVVEKEVLAPAWEPLTPERLEKLQQEPLHTQYWLACKQYEPEPVIAAIKRHAGRVYFSGEDDVFQPEHISHIMRFITPEMPNDRNI